MNPSVGFALALGAGLIWSIGNIIHKILASRLIKSPLLMAVVFAVVSAALGVLLLIWFPLIQGGRAWSWAVLGSVTYGLAVWGYLSAMRTEEASRIVPLFSIGSILIVIFSAVLLDEIFSIVQYTGVGLVLVGAVMISVTGKFRALFSSRLLRFMTLSGVSFAGHALVVKYLLGSFSYGSVFSSIALLQAGIGAVLMIAFWKHIRAAWRATTLRALALNIVTDFFNFGAELMYTLALSVWYLALVETIASLQYLFIFVWGVILSRWFPRVLREVMTGIILFRKLTAIIIIILGIYLIS